MDYNQILDDLKSAKFIVLDKNINGLYPEIAEIVKERSVYLLENAEEAKSLSEFEKASTYFLEQGISRGDNLYVIGGGATSDFGGFIASTILRGIKWRVYPTSLLAMIDAAIGGKVGINTPQGKNLIGQFHLPESVNIHFDFLKTLPERELISGKGELLKYCFLSEEILKEVKTNGFSKELLLMCAQYKQDIVDKDFKEGGLRKVLNYGHTFGHAIEKCSKLPHGISVAYGIEMIIEVFNKHHKPVYEDLLSLLSIKLPKLEKINLDDFYRYLFADKKKRVDGSIEFILVDKIGHPEIIPFEIETIKNKIKENEYATSLF